jgi:hypothetical protein
MQMDEALWEGLLDNIFRIFPYRCVPQRNHEYLRLVPRDGDSKKPVRLPSSSRARVITRWIKAKQSSRLACYSSRSRLSHAPATGHRARNPRS